MKFSFHVGRNEPGPCNQTVPPYHAPAGATCPAAGMAVPMAPFAVPGMAPAPHTPGAALVPPGGQYGVCLPTPQVERRTVTVGTRMQMDRTIRDMGKQGFSYQGERNIFPNHILSFHRTRPGFAHYPEQVSSCVRTKMAIEREARRFEREGWCLDQVIDSFPNHILQFSRTRITQTPTD